MKIDEFPTLFLPSQNALLTLLAYRCRLNAAYLPPHIDADGRDVLENTEPNPPARPKSSASPCPLLLTPFPPRCPLWTAIFPSSSAHTSNRQPSAMQVAVREPLPLSLARTHTLADPGLYLAIEEVGTIGAAVRRHTERPNANLSKWRDLCFCYQRGPIARFANIHAHPRMQEASASCVSWTQAPPFAQRSSASTPCGEPLARRSRVRCEG